MPDRMAINKMNLARFSAKKSVWLYKMVRTGAVQMLMKARFQLAANIGGPGLSDGDGHIVECSARAAPA